MDTFIFAGRLGRFRVHFKKEIKIIKKENKLTAKTKVKSIA